MRLFFIHLALFSTIFFTANAQTTTLIKGKPIEKDITNGERHVYQVNFEAEGYSLITIDEMGVWLTFSGFKPNGEIIDELDISTGDQGKQFIKIKATIPGKYQLEITPWEGYPLSGKYKIQIKELLTGPEYVQYLENENSRQKAVVHWLKENAIPLKGVEVGKGFEDMLPVKEVIGDARLVALGEATHGTREFFQLKHRMLEFLVNEMGFNIFAIEATMPEAFDINEYVLTGKGDAEKALAGLYFWTWNTEEVLELIRWMRQYNANPDHKRKVKFYGIDMQYGTRAVKVAIDFMKKVDYQLADKLKDDIWLSRIMNPYTAYDLNDISNEKMEQTQKIVDLVLDALYSNKGDYISQSSKKEWDLTEIHFRILKQYLSDYTSNYGAVRDSSMAENVRWILENEAIDSKMVIWAHNLHVNYRKNKLGQFLKDIYGDDIITFGFAFNQGSFQSRGFPTWLTSLRPYHVKPLPDGSLDAILGSSGLPFAVVDLRKIPDTGLVADWFSEPHSTRSIGPGFIQSTFTYADLQRVQQRYDALLFIDVTTAARPNPGGTRFAEYVQDSPENFDFEVGEVGIIPDGWNANKYFLANFDFVVETSNENPYQGNKCVKISRNIGRHYGENYGSLSQHLNAINYREKQVKLKVAVRTNFEETSNMAYVSLRTGLQTYKLPIADKEWKVYDLIGEVTSEDKLITLELALVGEGSVWFDALSFEIVE